MPAAGVHRIAFPVGPYPADLTDVVLNVTVTEPDTAGHLTAWPCDSPRPVASNINYVARQTVPNAVVVAVGASREVCFFSQARTHLVVDLSGTFVFGAGLGLAQVTPYRVLDTRTPIVPIRHAAGAVLELRVTGTGEVPASGVEAVALNVTVTDPQAAGFVTVYPCGQAPPLASNLNYVAGETVANLVVTKVGVGGRMCLISSQPTHLVADAYGWFGPTATARYCGRSPYRLFNTAMTVLHCFRTSTSPTDWLRTSTSTRRRCFSISPSPNLRRRVTPPCTPVIGPCHRHRT